MHIANSVKSSFSKYAIFNGRASRSEYWWYTLFLVAGYLVAIIADNLLGTTFTVLGESAGYGYLYLIFMLANTIPSFSILVRRLHDNGKSGWWYWIVVVPLVGAILLLVWLCQEGTEGPNRYGDDPVIR